MYSFLKMGAKKYLHYIKGLSFKKSDFCHNVCSDFQILGLLQIFIQVRFEVT